MVDLKKIEELAKDPERRMEAVLLYKEQTGRRLEEAEDAIKTFLKEGGWPEEVEMSDDEYERMLNRTVSVLEHPLQEAANLAKQGQKTEAAQKYQELVGGSLEESLEAIESYLERGDWLGPEKSSKKKEEEIEDFAGRTVAVLEHPLDPVKRAIQAGELGLAIERYQEATGQSPEDSKMAVEYFEKNREWLSEFDLQKLRVAAEKAISEPSRTASILEHPLAAVKRAIGMGDTQLAIEKYQDVTGHSIEEAKLAIEHFEANGEWLTQSELQEIKLAQMMENSVPMQDEPDSNEASILEHPFETVKKEIQSGNKQFAIEKYQDATGQGYDEARLAIEYFEANGEWLAQSELEKLKAIPEESVPDKKERSTASQQEKAPRTSLAEAKQSAPEESSNSLLFGILFLVAAAIAFFMFK